MRGATQVDEASMLELCGHNMLFLGLGQLKQVKGAPVRGHNDTEPSHVVVTTIGGR
jgi:hypothetical protein